VIAILDADAASEAQKELAERFGLNDKNSCWPLRAVADLLYVVGSRNQRQLKRTVPLPQLSLLALLELREPALRSIEENVQLAEYLSMVTWASMCLAFLKNRTKQRNKETT
jgi:hypothetical protein